MLDLKLPREVPMEKDYGRKHEIGSDLQCFAKTSTR